MPAMIKVGSVMLALSVLFACATGGSQTPSDASGKPVDAGVHLDGHNVVPPGDASSPPHDAHLLDAFVPQDAPDQSDGFCTDNTDCGTGTCCFVAICVAGTGVGTTLCFPS